MFHRRTIYDIYSEILQTCLNGALKTEVMYGCKLSFEQIERCLKTLTGNGLLVCEDINRRMPGPKTKHVRYFTTELGKAYLASYRRMVSLLEGENLVQERTVPLP